MSVSCAELCHQQKEQVVLFNILNFMPCTFLTLLRSSVTDLVLSVHFTFSSFSSGGVYPLMIHFKTDCGYFTHPTLLVIVRPDSFFHMQEILK